MIKHMTGFCKDCEIKVTIRTNNSFFDTLKDILVGNKSNGVSGFEFKNGLKCWVCAEKKRRR